MEAPTHRDEDERTVIASSMSPLSSAFADSVAGPESSTLAASLASVDEWYVGINGVPVGPIRLSELRSKASAGAISGESLVWREGFEQWLPLANFPELVAIVEEGLSSARASLTPLSPPMSQPVPKAAPRPEVYDPFALPGGGTPVVAQDPFQEMLRPSQPIPEALAPMGPGPAPGQQLYTPMSTAPLSQPRVDAEDVVLARPSRSGAFAWIAVAIALMLGLTIGFVMFSKKPPEPVVKYVEVPAKPGESAPTGAMGAGVTEAVIEVDPDGGAAKTPRSGGVAVAVAAKPGEKVEEKPISGLSGLSGLQGTGPTSGPGTNTQTGGGGGQPLDSSAIQQTVGKYTGSVKRSCWQPALDARAKDAPTSARVNVSIVVAPSGSVQSVSTSGDPKGYPGLASCIASRVKGWQFPASSGSTTVNVPFVFAAQ